MRTPALVLGILALGAALAVAGPLDDAFAKGQADGQAFGTQVGQAKGQRDGTKGGDRDGYAAGLKDAEDGISNPGDPGQPPPGDDPPPPLPPADPTPPAEPPPPADPTPPTSGPEAAPEDAATPGPDPLEDVEAAALARHRDLVPLAPGSRGSLGIEIPPEQLAYSKGFAVGFAAGFAAAYSPAKATAFKAGFAKGYARGQADWKRRATGEDGTPLTPAAQLAKARHEFQRGKFREAADRYDMVLARQDVGELADDALLGRSKALFALREYGSARDGAKRLVETVPESPLLDQALAVAAESTEAAKLGGFFGIGGRPDREAARALWTELYVKVPASPLAPVACFRIGALSEALREKAAARQAYRRVVESWPDHPLAAKARRRLAALGEKK